MTTQAPRLSLEELEEETNPRAEGWLLYSHQGIGWKIRVSTIRSKSTGGSESPEEIARGLETLTGDDRLDAGAIKNLGRATGAVTQSDFDEEERLRAAGDDLQIIEVGSATSYTDALAAQLRSDQPLRMVITADIIIPPANPGDPSKAYGEGEVLEFAPKSDRPESYETLPIHWRDNLIHKRTPVANEIEFNAAVASQSNVRTHLWIVSTSKTQFFVTINGARVPIRQGNVYHCPPRGVPEFIVDTSSTEEVNDAINAAISNGVALWARGPGQNVDDQSRQVYPKAGVFAPGFDNGEVLGTDGAGNLAWVSKGDGDAKLTQEQQIGLLNFRVTPEFISYPPGGLDTALTRTIELRCANPELLTGDIWYQGSVDGQAVVTRAKWSASTSVIRFVISAQLAALVGQNPQLELDLSFYNVATGSGAGTLVETLRYSVPLQIIPRPLHQTVSATSANTSVNADNGLTCDMPISFNTTLTITGGEDGLYLTIRPTQDTTGSRTITYNGAALDISTAGKSRDFLLFQREGSAWVLLGIRKGGDL